MRSEAQITFHRLSHSPALEADIRGWVDELDTFFDGIVSCRVVIDSPHRHHRQGRLFRVHVELGVPRGHIVVDRCPNAHGAYEDPHVAVRDAFRAARRQLEDHARRLRGDVKTHAGAGAALQP
jgi:hypothetical protein